MSSRFNETLLAQRFREIQEAKNLLEPYTHLSVEQFVYPTGRRSMPLNTGCCSALKPARWFTSIRFNTQVYQIICEGIVDWDTFIESVQQFVHGDPYA
ncbi:MAG: hypothetical protein KatS3mg022_2578 [Armatimonadota bacterium]|nr:MAG: hypothetical protein KatS3mg022_2578 [Armatimonadota bacterium]